MFCPLGLRPSVCPTSLPWWPMVPSGPWTTRGGYALLSVSPACQPPLCTTLVWALTGVALCPVSPSLGPALVPRPGGSWRGQWAQANPAGQGRISEVGALGKGLPPPRKVKLGDWSSGAAAAQPGAWSWVRGAGVLDPGSGDLYPPSSAGRYKGAQCPGHPWVRQAWAGSPASLGSSL